MRDHKSLVAWQEARAVTKAVLEMSEKAWKPWLGAAFNQLQRSALSVQLNIAEGYGYGESKSMRHHYLIASSSAMETGDLLELLLEMSPDTSEGIQEAIARCRTSQRLLLGLLRRYGGLTANLNSEQ